MKETELDIRMVKVEEVESLTRLYRWEIFRLTGSASEVKVGLKVHLETIPRFQKVKLRLCATYTRERGMVLRPLLDYVVDVEFEIDEYQRHFGADAGHGDAFDFPPSVLTMMLGVGVGAMRGMIALRTKGTPLADKPLPLINISSLVSRLIYSSPCDENTYPLSALVCG